MDWTPPDGGYAGDCFTAARAVRYDSGAFPCPSDAKLAAIRCYVFDPADPPDSSLDYTAYLQEYCFPLTCYADAGFPYNCPDGGVGFSYSHDY